MAEVQSISPVSQGNVDHGQYTAVSIVEDDLSTSLLQLRGYDVGNQTELHAVNDPNFPAVANRPKEGYRFPRTQAAHYPKPICCTFDIIQRFPWAHYDPVKDKLYCHLCVMAIKQGKVDFVQDELITTGFNDWPQSATQLWKHKLRDVHRNAREPPKSPTQHTQNTNVTASVSLPASGTLSKNKLSLSKRYAQWKVAMMKTRGESRKSQKIVTSKTVKPLRRCIHPSVAYLIELVKAYPNLNSIRPIRSNCTSTWRKIGRLMDEAGYTEFQNGRVCYKFWFNLKSHFRKMRSRYIKALKRCKDPRQVSKPSNAAYSKLLWLVPQLKLCNKKETNTEDYDMTALDAEQAENITDEDLKQPSDTSPTVPIAWQKAGKGKVYESVVIPEVKPLPPRKRHTRHNPKKAGKGKVYENMVIPGVRPLQPRKPVIPRNPMLRHLDDTISALDLLSYQLQLLDPEQRRDFKKATEKLYLEMNPTEKDAGLLVATTLQNIPMDTLPENTQCIIYV